MPWKFIYYMKTLGNGCIHLISRDEISVPEEGDEYLGGNLGQLLVRSCCCSCCIVVSNQEQGGELLLAVWRPEKKRTGRKMETNMLDNNSKMRKHIPVPLC